MDEPIKGIMMQNHYKKIICTFGWLLCWNCVFSLQIICTYTIFKHMDATFSVEKATTIEHFLRFRATIITFLQREKSLKLNSCMALTSNEPIEFPEKYILCVAIIVRTRAHRGIKKFREENIRLLLPQNKFTAILILCGCALLSHIKINSITRLNTFHTCCKSIDKNPNI